MAVALTCDITDNTYERTTAAETVISTEKEEMKSSWTATRRTKHDSISSVDSNSSSDSPFSDSPGDKSSRMNSTKKPCGKKRGRRPSKIDLEAKLERSRQSARECRARKKLRYKCLEDMIADKETYVYKLREELEMYRRWCKAADKGAYPTELLEFIKNNAQSNSN